MRSFKVFGDYGYVTEKLLAEFQDIHEARAFAEQYRDDMGQYSVVEVAWFALDGEYCWDTVIRADQEEPWEYYSD